MAEIVNFTAKPSGWAAIEQELRVNLAQRGQSQEVQDRLVINLKPFWEMLEQPHGLNFPGGVILAAVNPEQVAAFRAALENNISAATTMMWQAFREKLFDERLRRELYFCRELGLF
jgi:hypothetical protein